MIDRIDNQKRVARYAFESLAELAGYIETAPRTWPYTDSRDTEASDNWDLNAGFDTAWRYARDGWNDGAQKAKSALKLFAPATPVHVKRIGMSGNRVAMGRFVAGSPRHMIGKHKVAAIGHQRVLTLYVPVNATSSVKAASMRNFGLGVAQYINQLEAEGVRVELYAVMQSNIASCWRVLHQVCIKRASQPLDLAIVAFAIGHPAMFRRLGFALRERCASIPDDGYGRSIDVLHSDLVNPPAGAVILNGMKDANTTAATPQAALAYITRQIEAATAAQWAA